MVTSLFRYDKPLGKAIRFPLSLIPSELVLPILSGKMKGLKWTVGSSSHGCWLGIAEKEKQEELAKHLSPGDTFYDIGGHVGLHTLLGSRLVGDKGEVYTFEPFPRNISYLKRHINLNKIDNVTLFESAVSDTEGTVSFEDAGGDSSEGRITKENSTGSATIDVSTVSIDLLIERGYITPANCMKIDVEGAELLVLQGARKLLEEHHPTIFLATHGDQLTIDCKAFLQDLGYTVSPLELPSWQAEDEFIATYTTR